MIEPLFNDEYRFRIPKPVILDVCRKLLQPLYYFAGNLLGAIKIADGVAMVYKYYHTIKKQEVKS